MRLVLLILAACGSSAAKPDAEICNAVMCGPTCCTPAADCVVGACACPSNFIPEMPTFVTGVVVKNLPQIPGLLAAIGQFDQPTERDAVLVAYDPATAPSGIDIDLATSTDVEIGFGYQIGPNQDIRASYRATTGTVHLTSVCPAGVAGTLVNAGLEEIDIFNNLTPIAGGCTMALPSVTFAIASDCAGAP
jgi:hypothetical protein